MYSEKQKVRCDRCGKKYCKRAIILFEGQCLCKNCFVHESNYRLFERNYQVFNHQPKGLNQAFLP